MMKKVVYSLDLAPKYDNKPIFHLYIGIARIADLKPHEEIVEEHLKKLSCTIKKCRFLKNPIIVDLNSRVILDGMHRWHALKNLGFECIGVCYVDYKDPRVKLGRWFRFLKGEINTRFLIKELKKIEREGVISGRWIKIKDLENLNSGAILPRDSDEAFLVECNEKEKIACYYGLEFTMRYLARKFKLKLEYEPDVKLERLQKLLKHYAVAIVTPLITKDEVVKNALAGQVLPPRSTRHEIPARPMFVNFPLNLLKKSIGDDLHTLNRYFRMLLKHKDIVYIQSGLEIDREYREDIILFWDSRVGIT